MIDILDFKPRVLKNCGEPVIVVKVGMALAGLLGGFLLKVSGFDVALEADQTDQTLLFLRACDVVIPMVTSLIALSIMYCYEISESQANSIRAQLEERRGKPDV